MIPTFIGITLTTFILINVAPGSPIEQQIQAMKFAGQGDTQGSSNTSTEIGVNEEILEALKKQYGFDKPVHIRYLMWLKSIVTLDFGESFTYQVPVMDLVLERVPISLQFGITSLILTYLICIPLGVIKALRVDSFFDLSSTVFLVILYSIPPLALGMILKVFLAGHLDLFPLAGLHSDFYEDYDFWGKLWDRLHHFILPMICYMVGSFTTLTLLMKNSMLDVVKMDYIRTARAKGLEEKVVALKHALRNALIPIAVGFGGFLGIFLAGSLIIETIFSIPGMGLLSYESVLARDYNVIMVMTFFSALFMLIGRLISDLLYVLIDPRIDFS
jgi:microcin C transport system permease protein